MIHSFYFLSFIFGADLLVFPEIYYYYSIHRRLCLELQLDSAPLELFYYWIQPYIIRVIIIHRRYRLEPAPSKLLLFLAIGFSPIRVLSIAALIWNQPHRSYYYLISLPLELLLSIPTLVCNFLLLDSAPLELALSIHDLVWRYYYWIQPRWSYYYLISLPLELLLL